MGNHDAARDVLIAALKDEDTRDEVIEFVQKSEDRPVQSEYGRKMNDRYVALRADPMLITEVRKYGRLLPYALNDGAHPEHK